MVGHKQKDRYIIQASAIVEAIRIMLYASDTARKDSQIILSSRVVKMNQRLIINALSKLVLASKLASCVWPPPDAAENMNSALAEVLQAIRQFIVAAQDAGVVISLHNLEMMQHVNNPVTNSSVIATPTTATSEYSEASTLNGEVVESSPSNYYSKNYIPMASSSSSLSPPSSSPSPPLPPSSHFSTHQLIAELDRLTQSLVKMIDVLIKGIRLNQANASSLIAEVRAIVSQVGNVLSLVDEVSIDAVLEELAVDFKVNRLTLYNNVSGLVMATQAATSPLSPSNAIEQVIQSSGLISKSVKDLLVSTKCLIEEKENLEQSNLLDYINNFKSSSDLSGKPRRAFSLNEAMRPTALYHELNSNTTAPFSADSTFNAINATAPSTEVATIVHQMDPSLTNAPHTDTAEHQQQQQQQPLHATSPQSTAHYLQYDYRPEEIVNSMDGKVRGGTLNALIERLTLHDILGKGCFNFIFVKHFNSLPFY